MAEVQQNIAKCKVNEMIDMFVPLIAGCKRGKDMPAINLSGPPGVGKSDGIRALGAKVGEVLKKKVFIHDVRLLNMNPVDLRGIPAKVTTTAIHMVDGKPVEEEIDVARWLRPEIFQMDESPDTIHLLFLDEITAAPQSVQAAAYQLVLDRKVGEHELPDNCFVFCAGNRVADKSVAYRMPKALGNRMCHIEIYADVDDWKKWALNAGIDSRIIGFINYKPASLFIFDPSKDDLAYPTPRTWAMVDTFLKRVNNVDQCYPLIAGSIGAGTAIEFISYTKVYTSLPDVDAIFEGKKIEYPTKMDVCYALSSSLVSRAIKANSKQLDHMVKWLINWQPDYATITVKDCVKHDKLINAIANCPSWVEFYKKNGKFMNA